MTCQSCVRSIEERISQAKGVMGINVSLQHNTAAVVYLSEETNAEKVNEAICDMGFESTILEGSRLDVDPADMPTSEKSPLLGPSVSLSILGTHERRTAYSQAQFPLPCHLSSGSTVNEPGSFGRTFILIIHSHTRSRFTLMRTCDVFYTPDRL